MSQTPLLQDPAIPAGSTILVTGANGLIATHIIDQLLDLNYNVHGTVRNRSKSAWLTTFFTARHPAATFTLFEVPDMSSPTSFSAALQNCSGIIHTTSAIEMNATSPEPAISENVQTVMAALEAAAQTPSIKRFVLTSSAWTAAGPDPDVEFRVTKDSWNLKAVEDAYAQGKPESNGMSIFMAGKTKAEQAAWEFVQERAPSFDFNAVLPDTIFGSILSPQNQGIPSTAGLVKMLYSGQGLEYLKMIQPQWFIDVVDNAKLHVAALLVKDVRNERVLGHAEQWSWNDVLGLFRKWWPEREFVEDMQLGRDVSTVENERSLELLRRVYGMERWTSLEESVWGNVQSFLQSGAEPAGTVAKNFG